ncbi:alpha/beta hydrolase [Acuticoccus yangtzensis]|uniref:alpha/beta hydrolase n=1 Tax=Acuticoccus yangtzensis TaxID=1443441 RepID=UPI0009498C42|nr:alpha/beta hydrolase [Acuticoccus yangtzensis]
MIDKATRISSGADELAVEITEGKNPAILWLGGFRSDMQGGKAVRLAAWGKANGRRVVRFDYRGHGESSGAFTDFALGDWLADAALVDATFCDGPTIAVGSSMGGWIGLLLARQRLAAGRPLAGLVLIAPAPDFTERLMWPKLPDALKAEVMEKGVTHLPSDYGDPTPVTKRLFEDGRNHLLYTDAPIETGCPVHILQGVADPDVPYRHALELVDRLAHDDVVVTLIKDGDHRLSREEDLARMVDAVAGISE